MKKIIPLFLVAFLFIGCEAAITTMSVETPATTQETPITVDPMITTTNGGTTDMPVETPSTTTTALEQNDFRYDFERIEDIYAILLMGHYSNVNSDQLVAGAIQGMIDSLGDPYTYGSFIDTSSSSSSNASSESYIGLGLSVSKGSETGLYVNKVYKSSDAFIQGVREGDYIVNAKGTDISNMTVSEASPYLKGSLNDVIEIKVRRAGYEDLLSFSVRVTEVLTPTIESRKIVDEESSLDLGYIKINQFSVGSSDLFSDHLDDLESESIDKLIIDVRGNPGGRSNELDNILHEFTGGYGGPLYSLYGISYLNGEFGDITENWVMGDAEIERKPYDIVVLTDSSSASASEVFASTMKDAFRYKVIGETTYGKGVYQKSFTIRDDFAINLTMGEWRTVSGDNVHGIGVVPSIEIIDDYDKCYHPSIIQTLEYDMVSDEIKNIQCMLIKMGHVVRTDGYFDLEMQEVVSEIFGENTITAERADILYTDYLEAVESNDIILQRAIDELTGEN